VIIRKGNNRARWVDAGPSEGRVEHRHGEAGHLVVGARGTSDPANDRKPEKRAAA
jgi:hypothetical protein